MTEARQADDFATRAGSRLLKSLKLQNPPEVIQTDFDRLEVSAFELERRVLAANDAAKRCGAGTFAAEIENLSSRAESWLKYVRKHRAGDPSARIQQLQALLR